MTQPLPYVLVLRKVKKNMTSRQGFKWPEKGRVKAPDWANTACCGNGLHGFMWGVGEWDALPKRFKNRGGHWLVVRVRKTKIRNLGSKVKFPEGVVVFCGKLSDAANYMAEDKYCPKKFSALQIMSFWGKFSELNPRKH